MHQYSKLSSIPARRSLGLRLTLINSLKIAASNVLKIFRLFFFVLNTY